MESQHFRILQCIRSCRLGLPRLPVTERKQAGIDKLSLVRTAGRCQYLVRREAIWQKGPSPKEGPHIVSYKSTDARLQIRVGFAVTLFLAEKRSDRWRSLLPVT